MSVFAAVPLGNLARALAISQLFLAMMNHLEVQDIRHLRGNLVTTTPFELIPPSSHSDIQQAISHISSWSRQNLYQLNPSKKPLNRLTRIPADHAPDRTLFPGNNNSQLRSYFWFPDRLTILNDDVILSEDQKKGLCRNS